MCLGPCSIVLKRLVNNHGLVHTSSTKILGVFTSVLPSILLFLVFLWLKSEDFKSAHFPSTTGSYFTQKYKIPIII